MESRVTLSSAAVILHYTAGTVHITLSARSTTNSSTNWELPSTPIFPSHTSISSLNHTLEQTIGLKPQDISYREQLYTTEVASANGTEVCIAYLCLTRESRWHKGAQQAGIFPIDKLPPLKDTDKMIIRYALDRLHAKTLYSSIIGFLLPEIFDLTQLQQAFETVTRQSVDRRNFRKKILSLNLLTETEPDNQKVSPRTPARYKLTTPTLTLLETPFRMQPAATPTTKRHPESSKKQLRR